MKKVIGCIIVVLLILVAWWGYENLKIMKNVEQEMNQIIDNPESSVNENSNNTSEIDLKENKVLEIDE